MTTLLDNLAAGLSDLDIDTDEIASMFLRSDRTNLIAGETTFSSAVISGVEVEVHTTLRSAKLSRATILYNDRNPSNPYWSVSTMVKPCDIVVELVLDGKTVPLTEILRGMLNAGKPADKAISEPRFTGLLRSVSMLQPNMVMVTQHNGTTEAKANAFLDLLVANGGSEALDSIAEDRRNNIRRVVELSEGLNVRSMVLGSVDRAVSAYGRGFESLPGAQAENFRRVVTQRAALRAVTSNLEANRAKMTPEEISTAESKISMLRQTSTSWANNWGGVQEIYQTIVKEDSDEVERVATGRFAPVNVPCGDFTIVDSAGAVTEVNLWARKEEIDAEFAANTSLEIDFSEL